MADVTLNQSPAKQGALTPPEADLSRAALPDAIARDLVTFLTKADGFMIESIRKVGVEESVVGRLETSRDARERALICEEIRGSLRSSQSGHTGRFLDLRAYIPSIEQIVSESHSHSSSEQNQSLYRLVTTATAIGQVFSYTLTYSQNQAELEACLQTLNSLAKHTEQHLPDVAALVRDTIAQARPLNR